MNDTTSTDSVGTDLFSTVSCIRQKISTDIAKTTSAATNISCSSHSSSHACRQAETCQSKCAAYGKICPSFARTAAKAACQRMKRVFKDSQFFENGKPDFHKIPQSQINVQQRLGEGGFCIVNACTLKSDEEQRPLAIKYLKRQIMVERRTFEYGASDLANEAIFLAQLDHPNVIQLHGITEGTVEDNFLKGKDISFFMVVDRLVNTLEERITNWHQEASDLAHSTSIFHRMSREYKDSQRKRLKERLNVALEIAKVMEYLHSKRIVFRDLKPDNIGFDLNGTLKLFDFGLARELKECDLADDETYCMTGNTGSRRYMAPEVALDRPYNSSVDVYSFGILLWEIAALEKPFTGYCARRHMREVAIAGERPRMDSSHVSCWPVDLQSIITSCWSTELESRPPFRLIVEKLSKVIDQLEILTSERLRTRSDGGAHISPAVNEGGTSMLTKSPLRKSKLLKISRLLSRP